MMVEVPVNELPATPLFAGVENEDWPELLGRSVRVDALPGDAIFREGNEADAFFVVLTGQVEVRAANKSGPGEKALARLGAGSVLGETSLFLGGEHSASVYAMEHSTLLQFSHEGFREMVRSGHRGAIQVLYNIGNTLAVRLRAADTQIARSPVPGLSVPVSVIGNSDKARRVI